MHPKTTLKTSSGRQGAPPPPALKPSYMLSGQSPEKTSTAGPVM